MATDQEKADGIRKELIEAYKPIQQILKAAESAGFVVQHNAALVNGEFQHNIQVSKKL